MGYDNYFGKHWARTRGWLPASVEFKNNKDNIKYFTLCDIEAIDIFMLEKAGVLKRDANNFLTNVIICEGDNEKIPKIFEVTRPPLRESIISGKVERLLLFEDDDSTIGIDPDEDVRSQKLREKLAIKKKSERLKNEFPFDIINFDAHGSLLRPNRNLFRAFEKIFDLQNDTETFLLFVTTPINHPQNIEEQFRTDFEQNLQDFPILDDVTHNRFGTNDFNSIDIHKRIAFGFGCIFRPKVYTPFRTKFTSYSGIKFTPYSG